MTKATLLEIKCDDFHFFIKGPPPTSNSYALRGGIRGRNLKTSSGILIDIQTSDDDFLWPILEVKQASLLHSNEGVEVNVFQEDGEYLPLFYEQIDYKVELLSTNKNFYYLDHDSKSQVSQLDVNQDLNLLSGILNFRNNIGVTTLTIRSDSAPYIILTFTVFSTKIGFYADRKAMLDEISELHSALLFKLFSPTRMLGDLVQRRSLGIEWLTSFSQLSSALIKTIRTIEERAHRQIQYELEIIPIQKIKKPNRSLHRQIIKHGMNEVIRKRKVQIQQRRVQVNTNENRYIKFLMRKIFMDGSSWIDYLISDDYLQSDNKDQINAIEKDIRWIKSRLLNEFWTAVGEELPILQNRTTFQFQVLFQRLERLYKRLRRGIKIHEKGAQFISTATIDKMYEVWAYCKLTRIISGIIQGGIPDPDIHPRYDVDAFHVILLLGHEDERAIINIGDNLTISTNWNFSIDDRNLYFSPIVPQKPDLIFEVKARNVINIFDTKYRVDVFLKRDHQKCKLSYSELVTEDISHNEVFVRPKHQDINTMHRYRDAILTKRSPQDGEFELNRVVEQGIILYPHKPSTTESEIISEDFRLIQSFGIGSIPLAPGNRDDIWYSATQLIPDNPEETEQVRFFSSALKQMLDPIMRP